jgi:Replication initiator protein A
MAASKQPKKKSPDGNASIGEPSENRFSLAPQLPDEESYAQETNILNIEGFLFDLRRKHGGKAGNDNFEQVYTDQHGNELTITWHPKYGRPTVTAYNILQALFVKSTSEKYPFERAVTFHQNDILRLIGRTNNGKAHTELYTALKQLQNTTITYGFFNKELGKPVVADVRVIGSMFTVRDDKNSNKIEKALVYWDQLIVDSMNADYWAAFNWSRMKDLDAVQSILFKRLFHHFSKVASAKISALSEERRHDLGQLKGCLNNPFQKDMLDIFDFWLGGLKLPKHKSQIVQKYGERLDGLKQTGLIKSWKVEKRKTGTGFKLVAAPGSAFNDDYLGFYYSKLQPQLKFKKAKDDAEVKDPIELLVYFHSERQTNQTPDVETFNSKELKAAEAILSRHNLTGAREFVSYALGRARKDNYHVLYFTGILQYETDWLAIKDSRKDLAARKRAEARQQAEDALKRDYDRFCKGECEAWFDAQSSTARERLTREATDKAKIGPTSKVSQTFIGLELRSIIKTKLTLPTFEQWKKHRD